MPNWWRNMKKWRGLQEKDANEEVVVKDHGLKNKIEENFSFMEQMAAKSTETRVVEIFSLMKYMAGTSTEQRGQGELRDYGRWGLTVRRKQEG